MRYRCGKALIKYTTLIILNQLISLVSFSVCFYFRLHKTPGAHYESAATRMYIGGRTETIRSCSIESVDFAKAMLNAQSSNKERLVALQKAIKGHKDYTVQVHIFI